MNQTQWPSVTHKAILHAIQEQLFTPATKILNKNYWVARPSLSFPRRQTQGFTKGLWKLYLSHRHSWRLLQRKSPQTWRQAVCGRPGLHDKLVGMWLTESPQAALIMLLSLLNHPPQFWLEFLELPHPVGSMWSRSLEINGNPLHQVWSDNPKNWVLSLRESCLIISIRSLFSAG